MAINDYHFITHWRVKSTVEEIAQIIGDAPDLVRWWPSVYLDVQELEPGDDQGVGKVVSLYTKECFLVCPTMQAFRKERGEFLCHKLSSLAKR